MVFKTLYHSYGLFTAYFLRKEVMSVTLYVGVYDSGDK